MNPLRITALAARPHVASDSRDIVLFILGALFAHAAWLAVLTAGGAA